MGSSIITALTARKLDKYVGLLPLSLSYRGQNNAPDQTSLNVVAKSKPLDREVILMANSMAGMCSTGLREAYDRSKEKTGAAGCHLRELEIYNQTDTRLVRHIPAIYHSYQNHDREAYVIVMEQLNDVLLIDTADDVSGWESAHIDAALEGIAKVHSIWYERTGELENQTPPEPQL